MDKLEQLMTLLDTEWARSKAWKDSESMYPEAIAMHDQYVTALERLYVSYRTRRSMDKVLGSEDREYEK